MIIVLVKPTGEITQLLINKCNIIHIFMRRRSMSMAISIYTQEVQKYNQTILVQQLSKSSISGRILVQLRNFIKRELIQQSCILHTKIFIMSIEHVHFTTLEYE